MQSVPLAGRKHIAIFGATNAGKSALFNAILGQDLTIVSDQEGTTTDPVIKAMELIPYGPVALVDTAGLGDGSILGAKRMEKTMELIERTDYAIYAADGTAFDAAGYDALQTEFDLRKTPCLLVFTKADLLDETEKTNLLETYPGSLLVSASDAGAIVQLKQVLAEGLAKLTEEEDSMIGGLVPAGSNVILVCPIDSAAPKGRLILPQVQLIRDCLDHGIRCFVMREQELAQGLKDLKDVALVITDSQAFRFVSRIVPPEIPLTSFSILTANQKGDLQEYLRAVKKIDKLENHSRILIAEGCSHNVTHEDIGRIKIPRWLQEKTGHTFEFEFVAGHQFPADLSGYDFALQCGGCMLTRKEVMNRIAACKRAGVPITNYGVAIAWVTGILERCRSVFDRTLPNV